MHTPLGFCTPLKGKRLDCMIKLIATDMDGTFLDEKGSYDPLRFRKILDGLHRKDIRFAVASGRSRLALGKLFADFDDEVIFIAENGSFVTEGQTIHYEETMSRALYLSIIEGLTEGPFGSKQELLLSGSRASYLLETALPDYKAYMRHYYENIQEVADFKQIDDDIFKVTANLKEDHVTEGADWLTQNLNGITAVTTGFQSIDLIQSHVDKGTGLEMLCRDLTISSAQVLAFGDNLNDLEMLQFAGRSLAPANARTEIKAVADQIIGPHSEGSVLTYLEEFLA